MLKRSLISIFTASLVFFLGACATDDEKMEEEVKQEVKKVEETVTQKVVETPKPEPKPKAPAAPTLDETLLEVRTFYFDYDRSELRNLAVNALDVHAENILNRLTTNPNLKVVIEGHADERGTIAYNNALGNRRAEAVARYLRVKGVPGANIDLISYGELRPIDDGHNETAWQLNRRSVLSY